AGGRFAIDANTGVVTLAAGLDYETSTSHSVTVRATSTDGSSTTQSFTINVNDVDEFDATPVVDTNAAANEIDEDAVIGSAVGITASSDDADGTDSVSYSLDDDAGGRFAI
ncbi:cadherin repeat domain-containing protein, partial [Candidatus Laterigemmans baculatus]